MLSQTVFLTGHYLTRNPFLSLLSHRPWDFLLVVNAARYDSYPFMLRLQNSILRAVHLTEYTAMYVGGFIYFSIVLPPTLSYHSPLLFEPSFPYPHWSP
jgi:hypothetical protein